MLSDKDAQAVVSELAPVVSQFFVARPDSPRGLDANDLALHVIASGGGQPVVCESVAAALECARQTGDDVVVTGSVVTVAAARVACGLYPPE